MEKEKNKHCELTQQQSKFQKESEKEHTSGNMKTKLKTENKMPILSVF